MWSISQECRENRESRFYPAKKAQSGIEMLAFFIFGLLVFSIAYVAITEKTIAALDVKSEQEAAFVADTVALEISAAMAEGGGYSKTIDLPQDIYGSSYNVSVESGIVFVTWRNKNSISRSIVRNITGTFRSGSNNIENKEGVIFVTAA